MNDAPVSQILFAAWLAENRPDLFNALARAAGNTDKPVQLSGFTDLLSSIGSTIGSAAKSVASGLSSTIKQVGSFLGSKEGGQTLTALAGTYAAIKVGDAQAAALKVQADRASTGLPPADIAMQWDPARQTYVPVNPQGYALNAQQLMQYQPNFLSQYGIWIAGGLAALLLVLQLRK